MPPGRPHAALLIALALLVRGTQRMPRSWLWLAGSFLALQFLWWSPQFAQVNVITESEPAALSLPQSARLGSRG